VPVAEAERDLVVELRQRQFGFYDDDEESKESAGERVVSDALAALRQHIAQTQPEADPAVLRRLASRADQAHSHVAVLFRIAAFCTGRTITLNQSTNQSINQ